MYGGGKNKGRKLARYVTGGGGGGGDSSDSVRVGDGGLAKMGSMGGGKDWESGSRSENVLEYFEDDLASRRVFPDFQGIN